MEDGVDKGGGGGEGERERVISERLQMIRTEHKVVLSKGYKITILYPIGTATIVTIDIDADLSFVTKRDTNEQGYLAVRTKQLTSTLMIPWGVAYSQVDKQ